MRQRMQDKRILGTAGRTLLIAKKIIMKHCLFPGKFNSWLCPSFLHKIPIDIINLWWYVSGMKVKTSITLSDEILEAIDLHIGEYRSRSEFLETAARKFIAQLARKEAERRDLEIINRHADSLNAEAKDVLTYQVPL